MTHETTVLDTGFRSALKRLDDSGLLLKVDNQVDWNLELTSVLAREPTQAMIFNRVKDYEFRVLGNFLATERNILTVFRKDLDSFRQFINQGLASPCPPVQVNSGPVQEVFHNEPDLGRILPFLKYAPHDGGRYASGGIVIAQDADTGVYNASFHRFMCADKNRLLIRLDMGRHLRTLWEKAKAKDQPLPIAVVLGPDLSLIYAASIMGAQLPFEADEYHVASGIRRRPLELVSGRTVPLLIPAEAEVVMEGTVSPHEMVDEGPFMEFVLLYSEVAPMPVFTVNCVYHRRMPIWHVIMTTEAPVLTKPVREGVILKAVRAAAPCVKDLTFTFGGLCRFHLVMSVKKQSAADEGYQRNAAYAAITALKDIDLVIIVDDDIDIRNWTEVEWALATRWNASRGLILLPESRGHEFAPISEEGVRTKAIIDATLPFGFTKRHLRVPMPLADLSKYRTSLTPGIEV